MRAGISDVSSAQPLESQTHFSSYPRIMRGLPVEEAVRTKYSNSAAAL
jgi:hypothetical protein